MPNATISLEPIAEVCSHKKLNFHVLNAWTQRKTRDVRKTTNARKQIHIKSLMKYKICAFFMRMRFYRMQNYYQLFIQQTNIFSLIDQYVGHYRLISVNKTIATQCSWMWHSLPFNLIHELAKQKLFSLSTSLWLKCYEFLAIYAKPCDFFMPSEWKVRFFARFWFFARLRFRNRNFLFSDTLLRPN